jgi:hypothetical protein
MPCPAVVAALRVLLIGTGALMLGACAVGPNFTAPPPPHVAGYTPEPLRSPATDPAGPRLAQQRFSTGADIPTRWWAAFRSAPLNQLIRLSVERNPSLQSAEAAITVANYNALAQRGLYFPQVGVNYTPSDQQISNMRRRRPRAIRHNSAIPCTPPSSISASCPTSGARTPVQSRASMRSPSRPGSSSRRPI